MTATPRLPGRLATLLDRAHPYYHTIPTADRARLLRLPLAATTEEVDEVTALRLAAQLLMSEWSARAGELSRTRDDMPHDERIAALKAQHALSAQAVAAGDVYARARLALVNKYAPPTAELNP